MKKKVLSIIIAVCTLCLCAFSFTGCKKEEGARHYKREGNYIYFGRYLQTIKDESVTVESEPDESGYCVGSDGAKYRRITADIVAGRNYNFSNGEKIVDGKAY